MSADGHVRGYRQKVMRMWTSLQALVREEVAKVHLKLHLLKSNRALQHQPLRHQGHHQQTSQLMKFCQCLLFLQLWYVRYTHEIEL